MNSNRGIRRAEHLPCPLVLGMLVQIISHVVRQGTRCIGGWARAATKTFVIASEGLEPKVDQLLPKWKRGRKGAKISSPHGGAKFATTMNRTSLYLRVSTGRQATGEASLPSQRGLTPRYCGAQRWTVAEEFVEPGPSANDNLRLVLQQGRCRTTHRQP